LTFDNGAYVTVARPDIMAEWPERQLNEHYTVQAVSGETLPILKEVFLTLALERGPKNCVFAANITDKLSPGYPYLARLCSFVGLE
jgi:hypothetical protein